MKKIIIKTLIVLSGSEKRKFSLLIVLNLLISIIDIGSLAVLLFVVNIYTKPSGGGKSFLPEILVNQNSILLITLFLLLFTLKSIAGYFILKAQYQFVYTTASRISENNLLHFLEGSYQNYVNSDSAALIRKITHQPIEFAHYVLAGIQQIITEAILILLTVISILFFNAKLFLLLFAILLPAVIAIALFIRRRLKSVRMNVKIKSEHSLQYLNESLAGFIESNVYDKNDFFSQRYAWHQQSLNKYLADLQITQGASSRIIEVFAMFGLFVLITANKFAGNGSAIQLTVIGAFIAAAYKMIPGIVKILNTVSHMKTYEFTVNDLLLEVRQHKSSKVENRNKIDSLSFDKVSFAHDELFNDLSFKMEKNDFVGISGPSGKGENNDCKFDIGVFRAFTGRYIDERRYYKRNGEKKILE